MDANHREQENYFIALGAGNHQLPLIRAARELGFGVIAVDKNLRAPGFELANIHLQCSILRPGRILHLLQENLTHGLIAGVGCRSYGSVNLSAAILSRALGTPGPSLENIRAFRNKRILKERLSKYEIPVPRSFSWKTAAEKRTMIAASPLIARPSFGHGKMGIQILTSSDEVRRFLNENPVDRKSFLVEELIHGREATVLGLVRGGKFHMAALTDKVISNEPPMFAEVVHRYPSRLSSRLKQKIQTYMQKITSALALQNGPLVAEFMIQDDFGSPGRELMLVECAPEAGGEYIADYLVPAASGKNFFQETVRIFAGQDVQGPVFENDDIGHPPSEKKILIRYIMPEEGLLKSIRFPDRLQKHPGFIFSKYLKNPGDRTSLRRGNLDRLAVFILSGTLEQSAQLEAEMEQIVKDVEIVYEK